MRLSIHYWYPLQIFREWFFWEITLFFSIYNTGFSPLNPAIIFPLSPTNIIPSLSRDFPDVLSSSGVMGFIPPSHQKRSNAGNSAWAWNLNLIMHERGKAT